MHWLAGKSAQLTRAFEDGLQIVDREVQGFGGRMRCAGGGNIQHLQSHWAAVVVAPRTSLLASLDAEQLGVERYCPIEVAHLNVQAKKLGNVVHVTLPPV